MAINTTDSRLSCVSAEKGLKYWVLLRRCLWTDGNINNLETGLLEKPLTIYHHSKAAIYIILFKVIFLKHGNWNGINSKLKYPQRFLNLILTLNALIVPSAQYPDYYNKTRQEWSFTSVTSSFPMKQDISMNSIQKQGWLQSRGHHKLKE